MDEEEHRGVEGETEVQEDVVEIFPVEDPRYVALNQKFLALVREYVEKDLGIPSITFESFMNYLGNVVMGIFNNKIINPKTDQDAQKYKFLVGHVNGVPMGFCIFYMLPDRTPHIQTLEINHVCSKDIRLSRLFAKEFQRCKKKWAAAYILFTGIRESDRAYKRFFRHAKSVGHVIVAKEMRDGLLKRRD